MTVQDTAGLTAAQWDAAIVHDTAPMATAKQIVTTLTDAVTPNDESASSVVKPGMVTSIKNLYQSKPDNRGKTTWVDKYPDDLEDAAENAETLKYALIIRNTKCYDGR